MTEGIKRRPTFAGTASDAALGGMRRHPRDRYQERRLLQTDAGLTHRSGPKKPQAAAAECDVRNSDRTKERRQNARRRTHRRRARTFKSISRTPETGAAY